MKAHGLGFVVFFSVAIALRADAGEVRASEFGWSEEDATDALQAAIDSGAERVVVDCQ